MGSEAQKKLCALSAPKINETCLKSSLLFNDNIIVLLRVQLRY